MNNNPKDLAVLGAFSLVAQDKTTGELESVICASEDSAVSCVSRKRIARKNRWLHLYDPSLALRRYANGDQNPLRWVCRGVSPHRDSGGSLAGPLRD
jgi:hypothetical protein